MRSVGVVGCVFGVLLCACERPAGRRLAAGIAQGLTVRGDAVAFLRNPARPGDRELPDDVLAGELWAGGLGREARRVGDGVTTLPGAFALSQDGRRVVFLARWKFRAGEGELWVAEDGAEPVRLAPAASRFALCGANLAWVAPGAIGLRASGGAPRTVPLAEARDVAFSPDCRTIGARASTSAGGALIAIGASTGEVRPLAKETTDFAFAPDGAAGFLGAAPARGGDRPVFVAPAAGAPREVGSATAFAFSPDGSELALLSTRKQPGESVGELSRVERATGAAEVLGDRVADWRFAPDGALLFLARYDLRARAGALTLARRGQPPRELAPRVQSYTVEGGRVLYLAPQVSKGDFRLQLWAAELAAATPARHVDDGVYGWQVSGDTLFYKARCFGGPRSCSLLRLDLRDPASQPQLVAPDVAGFDLSADGARVLLLEPHPGATRAVDLAAIGSGGGAKTRVAAFASEVDAGAHFADGAGRRVVYAAMAAGEAGVFVADVPQR